jgi:hypothetical protein
VSQQINLFNPVFLKKKKYFSAVTMAQGLGLILVGSVAVIMYAQLQLSSLKLETTATANQLKQSKSQLAKVSAEYTPRQKSKSLDDEIQRMENELKSQQQAFDMVKKGGFGNTKGYSEYMRAFSRQILSGIWLTGFSINGPGTDIELRGRALQPQLVPNYINRLKQESVMKGKSFAALTMEVPALESESKGNAAAANKERALAPYIEFTLRSSDEGQEPAVSAVRPMIPEGISGTLK